MCCVSTSVMICYCLSTSLYWK